MPDGTLTLILALALGYFLLFLELFLPGGILGVLGFGAVLYGCYLAFEMGSLWGGGAVAASLLFSAIALKVFMSSRAGKHMVLKDSGDQWTSQEEDLVERWLHRRGVAATDLRPSGLATVDGERVDVITAGEFLDAGTPVQVIEVESSRIVVEEAAAEEAASEESEGEEGAGAA
ncbi:MAG: NfeD family protein [Acidobacteriota bacterium]